MLLDQARNQPATFGCCQLTFRCGLGRSQGRAILAILSPSVLSLRGLNIIAAFRRNAQTIFSRAGEAADEIQAQLPQRLQSPSVAIICGSGLQGLQSTVDQGSPHVEIPYGDIPYFPRPTGE